MNAKKAYRIMILLFAAGIVFSVVILRYANSWLTQTSVELSTLRNEVATLDAKRSVLENAQRVLKDNESNIATASRVLPSDKDQARIIKEIYAIAELSNVQLESVGFPASTLGTQTTPKPTAPAASTESDSASAQQTTPKEAPKTVSQATPLKDIPGVQGIELSLGAINSRDLAANSGVRYDEMITFIRLLERNQRTIQLKSIGIVQNREIDGEKTYNLDISLTIFIQA